MTNRHRQMQMTHTAMTRQLQRSRTTSNAEHEPSIHSTMSGSRLSNTPQKRAPQSPTWE